MTSQQFLISKMQEFLDKQVSEEVIDKTFFYENLAFDMAAAAEHVFYVWEETCNRVRGEYGD